MNNITKSHLALLFGSFIFGANYTIAKGLMPDYFSPLQIIFMRGLGALVLFWILQRIFTPEKVVVKDLMRIAFCSLFGVAINQIMFFMGLNFTTPVNASIIHASTPVIVLIFACIIIKEKVNGYKIIGIVLGITGTVWTIIHGKQISFSSDTFIGDIFIFINISAYSLYLVIVKPLIGKYSALTIMKWISFFGFIFILPFSVHTVDDINWADINSTAWASLLFIIIGVTVIAYLLTTYSLKYLSASVVGFYIYVQTVVAAIIALWIGNESLSVIKVVSASLVFIGVYLVSKHSEKYIKTNV